FFTSTLHPLTSTLFPYTTLFRSSKYGVGDWRGSYRTPVGELEIAQKIGDGMPPGTVFKDRRQTGEIVGVNAPGRDPIVTRIIWLDRKSTRLNSSHLGISYAVFCL